jgi:hypothetical protein
MAGGGVTARLPATSAIAVIAPGQEAIANALLRLMLLPILSK